MTEQPHRSGFACFVGRPNAGKSTLTNAIVGTKVAITSSRPQTTRTVVRGHAWPDGPGYFWLAGESAQMRDVRRHVRHDLGWDNRHHEAMGYWSASRGRAVRKVDPGPIYARGKAQGKSDEEIWAEYDAARDQTLHGTLHETQGQA